MPTISCPSSGPGLLTSPLAGRDVGSASCWSGAVLELTVASDWVLSSAQVPGGWRPEVDDVFARLGTSTFSWCGRGGEHEATVTVAGRAWYSPGKVMNVACPYQHSQCWRTSSDFLLSEILVPFTYPRSWSWPECVVERSTQYGPYVLRNTRSGIRS